MTIYIKFPQRITTITLHHMLYQLISLHLTKQLDSKKSVSQWLSNQLYQRLGNLPKRNGKSENLAKYAVEEILKTTTKEELIKQFNQCEHQ